MTAERRLQLKRKAQGKCIRCGGPTPVGVHCNECRELISDRRLVALTLPRISYLIQKGLLDPKEVIRTARNSRHVSDPAY